MATLNIPITFTQFSPYVRGTVTYEWTDTAAVSAVSGFNASADGISSVTTNLSSANVVVAFDSNVDATVNLTTCTSGAQLTVPDDYNKDILLKITSDLQVGQVHSATSTARRVLKHTFVGTSDSIFTSSPANPTFTDIEVLAGTKKSLGTFSVNDVDAGSPTYSATLTYRKDLGTITYSDASIVNSSHSSQDIISTTNVSTLNTVLSDMQYVPDVNGNPATNQNAIVGDTLTLSIESTADNKIVGGKNIDITTTISDTIQLTNTASSLAFNEFEVASGTAKAFGTNVGVSPVFNNAGVTVNCKITYDKAKTTITYPDTSIVDTTQPTHDTISTTDISKINTALQTMTVIPINQIGGSAEIEGNYTNQSLAIELTTSPAVAITNSTTSLSYGATNEFEMSNAASGFGYTENLLAQNIFGITRITDTHDSDAGTNELYAVVLDFADNLGAFTIQDTTNITSYNGTGAQSDISSKAKIFQATKTNFNNAMANGGGFQLIPTDELNLSSQVSIKLYRAPHGTSSSIDINSNIGTFTKIFDSGPLTITSTSTTSLSLNSLTANGNEDTVISLSDGTIKMSADTSKQILLTVKTDSTLAGSSGTGGFGTISDTGGSGTYIASTKTFHFTGTESQVNTVLDNLQYTPGAHTTGSINLIVGTIFAGSGIDHTSTPTFTKTIAVTVNSVVEEGQFRSIDQQNANWYYNGQTHNDFRDVIVDIDQTPVAHDVGISIINDTDDEAFGTNSANATVTLSSVIGTLSSDGGSITDTTCDTSQGSTTLTVENANFFHSGMQSKSITVTGAGASSSDLTTTIQTVIDDKTITMADPAGTQTTNTTITVNGLAPGTWNSSAGTYAISGVFRDVNASLQSLKFTNDGSMTASQTAQITASYTTPDHTTTAIEPLEVKTGQQNGTPNSGTVIDNRTNTSYLYRIRACDMDPVYISTASFSANSYVQVNSANVEVFEDPILSSGTPTNQFGKKTVIALDTMSETTTVATTSGTNIDITASQSSMDNGETSLISFDSQTVDSHTLRINADYSNSSNNGNVEVINTSGTSTIHLFSNNDINPCVSNPHSAGAIYYGVLRNFYYSQQQQDTIWTILKNNVSINSSLGQTQLPAGTIKVHNRSIPISRFGHRNVHGYQDPYLTPEGIIGLQNRHWLKMNSDDTGVIAILHREDFTAGTSLGASDDVRLIIVRKN